MNIVKDFADKEDDNDSVSGPVFLDPSESGAGQAVAEVLLLEFKDLSELEQVKINAIGAAMVEMSGSGLSSAQFIALMRSDEKTLNHMGIVVTGMAAERKTLEQDLRILLNKLSDVGKDLGI